MKRHLEEEDDHQSKKEKRKAEKKVEKVRCLFLVRGLV
jgi:hypothetical protein